MNLMGKVLRGSGIETEQKESNEGGQKADIKMTARVHGSSPKLQFNRDHLHLGEAVKVKVCFQWVSRFFGCMKKGAQHLTKHVNLHFK